MGHMWFVHDAHLGRVFLFLHSLAEYRLLSMTDMVTPCLWCVVGMKLGMSYVKFPQAPFACTPFGECRPNPQERRNSFEAFRVRDMILANPIISDFCLCK